MADFVFYGGDIITMDEDLEQVEALAIADGTIISVGSLAEVLQNKRDQTVTIDLQSATLMPGFIEPHQHALIAAQFKTVFEMVDGSICSTYEQLKHIVEKKIAGLPADSWAIFFGWDPELTENLPALNAEFIDKNFSSEVPVVFIGQSLHIAWANSKALELARISDEMYKPVSHFFDRDEHGKFTGIMYEATSIIILFKAATREVSNEAFLQSVREQWLEYTKGGITTTTEMALVPFLKPVYDLAWQESGKDSCTVRLAMYQLNVRKPEIQAPTEPERKNPFFWMAGEKLITDGSPHCGTIAVLDPFLENNMTSKLGFPKAPCYGKLNFSSEALLEMVREFHQAGKQIAIHAHGERACEQVLDVYEQVLLKEDNPRKDCRHRIEHVGLITEAQIQRASKMNLALSFFANHLYHYGKSLNDSILGPERTKRFAPCSLGTKHGLVWSLHQDHPAHPGLPRPLHSMKAAVTRTDKRYPDTVYGPEYCVTVHEAMKAYTVNAAWQLHMEDKLGSLTVGKLADLQILSHNPYKVDPMFLDKIEVLETFVAGRQSKLSQLVDQAQDNVKILQKKDLQ